MTESRCLTQLSPLEPWPGRAMSPAPAVVQAQLPKEGLSRLLFDKPIPTGEPRSTAASCLHFGLISMRQPEHSSRLAERAWGLQAATSSASTWMRLQRSLQQPSRPPCARTQALANECMQPARTKD